MNQNDLFYYRRAVLVSIVLAVAVTLITGWLFQEASRGVGMIKSATTTEVQP